MKPARTASLTFRDHFSEGSAAYAAFRPRYPAQLFDFLASLVERRRLAWDCATGSGQAATGLAAHFQRVVATDASAAQIANALPHPRVDYRVAPAEVSGLESASADLVTVAQALHWLDLESFYAEVRRVLAPGGALAIWGYAGQRVDPAIDPIVEEFMHRTLAGYWPPGREILDRGYARIPFPFQELSAPHFTLERVFTLDEYTAYLRTWSAVRRYIGERGEDPVDEVARRLGPSWGERRTVTWPIALRVGRAVAKAID